MNEWNKLLWLLFMIAINGLVAIIVKLMNNKKALLILGVVFVLILLIVSYCWVFMSFWK